jgi:hypothetical protein
MNYKLTQQHILETSVRKIFEGYDPPLLIISNARKIVNVVNPTTGFPLEIDVYVPQLKLGFEYQVNTGFSISIFISLFSIFLFFLPFLFAFYSSLSHRTIIITYLNGMPTIHSKIIN